MQVYIIIIYNAKNLPDANAIFLNSIDSVVELKGENFDSTSSYGTGVIFNEHGYIVTNAHVVVVNHYTYFTEYDKYSIRFATHHEYIPAQLISFDDLAILKIVSEEIFEGMGIGNTMNLNTGNVV